MGGASCHSVLFFLSIDLTLVPWYALGPELTPDYEDRSSLFSTVVVMSIIGVMFGAIIPGIVASECMHTRGFRGGPAVVCLSRRREGGGRR